MEAFTVEELLRATNGVLQGDLIGDAVISEVCIDSRCVVPGALFVPIKGDRFDGHDFIEQAFAQGALCALCSDDRKSGGNLIRVHDTGEAFQKIAGAYRNKFSIPFVGVTGSVGKTTTKELISDVLSQKYTTLKNQGNLNNQTGVPLTLLRLNHSHEAAVVEMGTNHFGEIARLAKIVRPSVCVFTNIGDAHIEYLGSREGILKAKCEMLDFRDDDAIIIANGDDSLLRGLKERYTNVLLYGFGAGNDVYATDIRERGLDGSSFIAHYRGTQQQIDIPAPGSYMVSRALCAIAVGAHLGVTPAQIAAGVAAYAPISGRMTIEKTERFTILNDAYNANPTSVAASIDITAKAEGRRVLILGDMFELGKDELLYHRQIGAYAAKKGIELILCVGRLSSAIYDGAKEEGGNVIHFNDKEALKTALHELLLPGDTILIKASNGMKLQELSSFIQTQL